VCNEDIGMNETIHITFTGPPNSGKTTLIRDLEYSLRSNYGSVITQEEVEGDILYHSVAAPTVVLPRIEIREILS
jgi:Ni2+-binding GTPase involved in maturation of urease and hydrogenase